MRISIFFLAVLLVFTFSAQAQKGQISLSAGPSVGVPLNFNTGYKTGFGGALRGYFGVSTQGSVLANVNVISFPGKLGGVDAVRLTSLKIGYKSTLSSPRIFIYGDGGLVFKSGKQSQNDSDFGLGTGLGYSIPVGNTGSIDLVPSFNMVFQSVANRTWLDVHLAYRFQL